MKCAHEDDIQYGKTVYKTPVIHAVLVQCSTCEATGAQIAIWDDIDADYIPQDEAWHDSGEHDGLHN